MTIERADPVHVNLQDHHQQMIFDAWERGTAIEGKRIGDDQWLDVPAKGSDDAHGLDAGDDYQNWEYRIKGAGGGGS